MTNITDVYFAEDDDVLITFVNAIDGFTGVETETLELADAGAHFTWIQTTGEAPDPVTTIKHTWFVPWSNVKVLKQSEVV
jgi:hypothetical protein